MLDPRTLPTILETDDLPKKKLDKFYKVPTPELIAYLDFSVSTTGVLSGVKVSWRWLPSIALACQIQTRDGATTAQQFNQTQGRSTVFVPSFLELYQFTLANCPPPSPSPDLPCSHYEHVSCPQACLRAVSLSGGHPLPGPLLRPWACAVDPYWVSVGHVTTM